MTLEQIRRAAALKLNAAGFENPTLESRLLCEIAFYLTATQTVTKANQQFNDKNIEPLLKRRLNHEPIARIRGYQEFYSLNFMLNEETLIPRQDTECLVEAAIALKPKSILDLGTGSGAILISILKHLPQSKGMGVDIAPKALLAASENAKNNAVKAQFMKSDWFEAVDDCYDLIISNPPYIALSEKDSLQAEVKNHDPAIALFAEDEGYAAYHVILSKALEYLNPKGHVIVEVGHRQAEKVEAIALSHNLALVEAKNDINGVVRALIFKQKPK